MDYDKTLAIVGEMAAYHPKKAKKISLLLNYWLDATEEEKKALEKEIRDLIVDDFHRSLDRTSRTEYVNCNVNVHEFSYTAEHNVPGWDITTWGANRLAIENGEVKVLETIPRIYKKGYVLPKDASEEAEEALTRFCQNSGVSMPSRKTKPWSRNCSRLRLNRAGKSCRRKRRKMILRKRPHPGLSATSCGIIA